MYFERALNGDKDIVLPFITINKGFIMEGKIKNLSINAPVEVYNLVNKCFLHNLSYDDGKDALFNCNY